MNSPHTDEATFAVVNSILRARASVNLFEPSHSIADREIELIAELATRAPSAFNLQNWRLHAVRTAKMKRALRLAAFDQAKVEEAAVTFVLSGELARAEDVEARLAPALQSGMLQPELVSSWTEMARGWYQNSPRAAREEAIRSATLLASTLMFAAAGRGFASAPLSGFDRGNVKRLLHLPRHVLPVLLVAVGHPRAGNWPQKPRRPVADVLTIV